MDCTEATVVEVPDSIHGGSSYTVSMLDSAKIRRIRCFKSASSARRFEGLGDR
ncbi:hypothetical protein NUU18_08450 [Pediococcus pentosaceus]|uniref:hypothetical protein n=1 Tax=Pediococcus pentosaceus TaxID=1255 RepID=UPI0021E7A17C|nr:hypothetical protein [Pediococcus pentosaceus]MCV3326409.1 hypothetical protein [Pediococcus pentosaceus]